MMEFKLKIPNFNVFDENDFLQMKNMLEKGAEFVGLRVRNLDEVQEGIIPMDGYDYYYHYGEYKLTLTLTLITEFPVVAITKYGYLKRCYNTTDLRKWFITQIMKKANYIYNRTLLDNYTKILKTVEE